MEFTGDLSDTIHLGSGFGGSFISMRISVATKIAGCLFKLRSHALGEHFQVILEMPKTQLLRGLALFDSGCAQNLYLCQKTTVKYVRHFGLNMGQTGELVSQPTVMCAPDCALIVETNTKEICFLLSPRALIITDQHVVKTGAVREAVGNF